MRTFALDEAGDSVHGEAEQQNRAALRADDCQLAISYERAVAGVVYERRTIGQGVTGIT